MKTCPTCVGEGKVKESVDLWPERRKQLARVLGLGWRGLLVGATPFVLTIAAVCATKLALWSIGAPFMTPSNNSGPLSPAIPLQIAVFVGLIGGLVLAIALAAELEWKTCSKAKWCCDVHRREAEAEAKATAAQTK